MLQLRQLAPHAEQHQHGAGAARAPPPPRFRIGLQRARQQSGLHVMEVRGGDDDIGAQGAVAPVGRSHLGSLHLGSPEPLGVPERPGSLGPGSALGGARSGEDPRGAGAGVQAHALALGETDDGIDQRGEAALRILHPTRQVQGAHQVVHARGAVRRGAEEHRRIAEHLAQPRIPEAPGDEPLEGLGEQRQQPGCPGDHGRVQESSQRGEGRIQEVLQRQVVGVPGGVEVLREPASCAGFDLLEGVGIAGGGGVEVQRLLVSLEEHAVARVQGAQVQLLGGRCAEEAEEVVEDLGHQVPGGAGVEAEAVALPRAGAAAELLARLDQVNLVAVAGQQGGGRESGDPAADDDRCAGVGSAGDGGAGIGGASCASACSSTRARICAFS